MYVLFSVEPPGQPLGSSIRVRHDAQPAITHGACSARCQTTQRTLQPTRNAAIPA